MTKRDKFNVPVYWQIGTDIKLSFPTKKEYEEAKKRVYKALPILCNTCLHEHNCDGQCGFAGNNTSNIEMMGNSKVIVESGGSLIISGGTLSNVDLVLKPGSSLQILNGGILETLVF